MARRDESGPQQFILDDPGPTGPVVRVRCTKCDKKLRVRAVHAGKKVRCPKCGKKVKVVPSDDIENVGEMIPDTSPPGFFDSPKVVIACVALAAAAAAVAVWLYLQFT